MKMFKKCKCNINVCFSYPNYFKSFFFWLRKWQANLGKTEYVICNQIENEAYFTTLCFKLFHINSTIVWDTLKIFFFFFFFFLRNTHFKKKIISLRKVLPRLHTQGKQESLYIYKKKKKFQMFIAIITNILNFKTTGSNNPHFMHFYDFFFPIQPLFFPC